jgi:hypothetical protein
VYLKRCFLTLILAFGCVSCLGCKQSALPPPLNVTFRASILGQGQVAVVKNNSSHHLYNVKVVGRNLKNAKSASVRLTDHLSPGATTEVGWLEFERWIPEPGETLEFYADDYLVPKIVVIPPIK